MRRIIAEVLESNLSGTNPGHDALPWRDVTCRVKLLSSVPESHHLPEDIKDTTCTITRRALFDWEYKPGSRLVLRPEECEPLVRRPADTPPLPALRGRVATYRTDIDADGFAERIVENSFARVTIAPRFGARISQITLRSAGWSPLHATHDFSKDWFELGGQEDHISEQGGQGEFWNAAFVEKEIATDEKGFRAIYEFKSEKSKGVTLTKEITVAADAPIVYFRCTLRYAGAEKPPEDGKPDEFEATFWPRVGISVPELCKHSYVFIIPTKTRLHRLRRNRGWHTPRAFGLSAPYHLALNEDTGMCLALLLDPAQTHFGMVCEGRSEFETIEPKMKKVKIAKDGEQSYGFALAVGQCVRADQDCLAITASGTPENGKAPVFAMSTVPAETSLRTQSPPVSIDLTETDYPGLPKMAQGVEWIECS